MKFDATIKMILEASGLTKTTYVGINDDDYTCLLYTHKKGILKSIYNTDQTDKPVFVVCSNDEGARIEYEGNTIQDIVDHVNGEDWGDDEPNSFTPDTWREWVSLTEHDRSSSSGYYLFENGEITACADTGSAEEIIPPPSTKAEWKKWLDTELEDYTINPDGSIDVVGDVDLYKKGLKRLPFKFGNVTGNFYCNSNNLKTLEGAPSTVDGLFDCTENDLDSLKGLPKASTYDVSPFTQADVQKELERQDLESRMSPTAKEAWGVDTFADL